MREQIIEESRVANFRADKTCDAACYGALVEFTEMNADFIERTAF